MHALIIEDDALIALSLEGLLRERGFNSCAIADTEAEAVAAAARRFPDLITADLRLRAGTGTGAVQTIRARQHVPVVYVTGNARDVGDAPADLLVEKPFSAATLTRAIEAAMAQVPPC